MSPAELLLVLAYVAMGLSTVGAVVAIVIRLRGGE